MEELYELFEKSENLRHKSAIKDNPEFFPPERGVNYYKYHNDLFLKKLETHEFGTTSKTGENLEALKKYALSTEEGSVLYMYTHHNIYNNLNCNLRHNIKLHEDELKYIELLNISLNKFPEYNSQTVYRDIRNPEEGFEKHLDYYENKINDFVTFNDFLSCHTDDVRISDEKEDYQFVIQTAESSNARDIKELTFISLENEVLFKNGSRFMIKKVDREKNQVYMMEI
ncbi:MAG: ADP-ribosyltransferase [Flavobacterium sp.]